jgi:lipopolysaccharide transport system ATP-binding protein
VGTGFHAELTGRENIYLSGAILGMKKREIDRKFDEIVAFAEVERFLDTPVKHYSSGMYVRVAFAVAAHLEPEILLVDEVLAVGDASFQKKCLGKMGDVAGEGRTVLFVSHNMAAVENLCSRALWLDKGRVSNQGHTDLVICEYLQTTTTSCVKQVWPDWNTAPGNGKIRLRSAQIRTDNGTNPSQITTSMAVSIEITYWNLKPDVQLNLSLLLFNQEGICVLASTNAHDPKWPAPPFPVGIFRSICSIPGGLLNAGLYRVKLLVVKDSAIILYHHEDVLVFEVHDSGKGRGGWYGKWPGVIRPNLQWSTELLTDKLLTDRTQ